MLIVKSSFVMARFRAAVSRVKTAELTRLLLVRNKSGRNRIIGMSLGIALGVALFLVLIGAFFGMDQRGERGNWADINSSAVVEDPEDFPLSSQPEDLVAFAQQLEYFKDVQIRVIVLAPGVNANFLPPGIPAYPAPGTFYASPALAELIQQYPSEQLGDRFGTLNGEITEAGLTGPSSLLAVVGADYQTLNDYGTLQFSAGFTGTRVGSDSYQLITILGAIALLIPVLLLVSIVTGLGGKQRQERYATLRLIGAKRGGIANIAALETAIASLAGSLLGIGLYFAVLPLAARVEVTEGTFFVSDLLVDPSVLLGTLVLTVTLTAATAWLRTWFADLGPLGASREKPERKPTIWSLIPLILGLILFASALFNVTGESFLLGFVLLMVGPIVGGAYLTRLLSRSLARTTQSGSGVIAYNRIVQHPRASFRAVSGLTVALFAVTVFTVGLTAVFEDDYQPTEGSVPVNSLLIPISPVEGLSVEAPGAAHPLLSHLLRTQGAEQVAVIYSNPGSFELFVRSDELALQLPQAAAETDELLAFDWSYFQGWGSYAPIPVAELGIDLSRLTPEYLLVLTDGRDESLDRVRTAAQVLLPTTGSAQTILDMRQLSELSNVGRMAGLANIGILIASAISLVSLAVSTISGILDRKRVLSLMRLAGIPVKVLRKTIALETLIPLLSVFFIAVGSGIFAAFVIVESLSSIDRVITAPGLDFYLVLAAILAMAAAAVGITTRAVESNTEQSVTRFE